MFNRWYLIYEEYDKDEPKPDEYYDKLEDEKHDAAMRLFEDYYLADVEKRIQASEET